MRRAGSALVSADHFHAATDGLGIGVSEHGQRRGVVLGDLEGQVVVTTRAKDGERCREEGRRYPGSAVGPDHPDAAEPGTLRPHPDPDQAHIIPIAPVDGDEIGLWIEAGTERLVVELRCRPTPAARTRYVVTDPLIEELKPAKVGVECADQLHVDGQNRFAVPDRQRGDLRAVVSAVRQS